MCKIEGCENTKIYNSGYCGSHYWKYKKYGDALYVTQKDIIGYVKDHPLYYTYNNMLGRCYNKNNPKYYAYGERGITVCDSWKEKMGFVDFVKDIGEKPTPSHTVDRIDVDGNYCKENCRWATTTEQAANKRNNNKNVGCFYNKSRKSWIANFEVGGERILFKSFKTEQEAIDARKEAEDNYFNKVAY